MGVEATIKVTPEVKGRLDKLKNYPRETYNDVIDRLTRDALEEAAGELTDEDIRDIEEAIADIKAGREDPRQPSGSPAPVARVSLLQTAGGKLPRHSGLTKEDHDCVRDQGREAGEYLRQNLRTSPDCRLRMHRPGRYPRSRSV
jgi:predicted CopG family antitoxin